MGRQAVAIARIAMLWIAVVAISSIALYSAELGQNPAIESGLDALWWAVVTTTVGFGDIAPVTAEGRLAAAFLMVLGIAFFSYLVATITASLTAEKAARKRKPKTVDTLDSKIAELDKALASKRITHIEHKRLRTKILNQF